MKKYMMVAMLALCGTMALSEQVVSMENEAVLSKKEEDFLQFMSSIKAPLSDVGKKYLQQGRLVYERFQQRHYEGDHVYDITNIFPTHNHKIKEKPYFNIFWENLTRLLQNVRVLDFRINDFNDDVFIVIDDRVSKMKGLELLQLSEYSFSLLRNFALEDFKEMKEKLKIKDQILSINALLAFPKVEIFFKKTCSESEILQLARLGLPINYSDYFDERIEERGDENVLILTRKPGVFEGK